ncbi:MAG TPA: ABC transporter ATP-binding protein [Steroidobacteraceae bacterium]|nr:ABC transporter ATP-binding protein [Steroidobacteraceae bacterium]
MSALLVAEHLRRTLPGVVPVTLIDDVSLTIDRGEFVAIMGPSGSGKSSLLYLLGLLDVPTSGRIELDGEDTASFDENQLADVRLRKLGFVFQFHFLLAEFTVLDNMLLPMMRLGLLDRDAAAARARELLSMLGMDGHAHKRPGQLSGGQRQRVAIARALANDPLVILTDEPTGNLDSGSAATVQKILRTLVDERGKTVIAVTHDATFAGRADRRIGIVDGRIDPDWVPPTLLPYHGPG